MQATYIEEDRRGESVLGLFGVLATLVGGAALLYALAGPPRLPERVPSWALITSTLGGSDVPLDAVAYVFTTAAWLLWIYIVGSLLFHTVVAIAEALTHGAAWAGSLRAVSERVTLPIVRKLVDRAVVALLVVNLVGRSVGTAAAAPPEPIAAVVAVSPRDATAPPRPALDAHERHQEQAGRRTVQYTVQPGDSLWKIAERFYGVGDEWKRVMAGNVGRRMPDGRTFDRTGVIQPGWVLEIQLPSTAVEEAGGRTYYVVEEGDMLRGIAARLLGDEMRWPEIFEPNRGVARLSDGRTLTNPDLIWPGLRLQVPLPPVAPATPETRPAPRVEPPAPAPSPPPPAPVRVEPTPQPTVVVSLPTAAPREPTVAATPAAVSEVPPVVATGADGPSTLLYGAVGLGAAAAIGGGIVLARRRPRRRMSEPRPPSVDERVVPSESFADADVARLFAHRLHGGEQEPAVLVAEHARRFFAEHGLGEVSVVVARSGRDSTGLMLSSSVADQGRLLELASAFGARLGGRGRAWLTPDHDVMLQVTGPRLLGVVNSVAGRPPDSAWLVPVGVLSNGETLYANWRQLGHVLIAGLPGGGAEVVLTSLLGGLSARCRPDELKLWTIARRRTLSLELAGLPHQCQGFVDPDDEDRVTDVLDHLRDELIRRMERRDEGAPLDEPELVLVVGDLEELVDDATAIELIGSHGPEHGVRLLAATTQPGLLGEDVLGYFGSRVVLQTLDDDQSVQLLGQPDGSDLGGGDLFLRVDRRMPLRARGLRIAPDHLEQLVGLMREAYGLDSTVAHGEQVDEDDGEELAAEPDDDWTGSGDVELVGELVAETARPTDDVAAVADQLPLDGVMTPEADDEVVEPFDASGEDDESSSEEPDGDAADPDDREPSFDAPAEAAAAETPVAAEPPPVGNEYANGRAPDPPAAIAAALRQGLVGLEDGVREDRPLVEVQCFGAFAVRSRGQEILPSGDDGRFKAWELLAYLASQPRDSVTVDKLLGAVWPDVGKERARNRMWTTMNKLRAILREQVPELALPSRLGEPVSFAVRADRDGFCRLDARLITSDVHEFMDLCETARRSPPADAIEGYEQAREIYRGDLLVGRNARFFEWVHDREGATTLRDRYREEHGQATHQLARLLREHGRVEEAIALLKELLKEVPTLEDVVQDLFRCYRETGDLSALIREERQLRLALVRDYGTPGDSDEDRAGCEPEADTTALFREISDDLRAKLHAPQRIA